MHPDPGQSGCAEINLPHGGGVDSIDIIYDVYGGQCEAGCDVIIVRRRLQVNAQTTSALLSQTLLLEWLCVTFSFRVGVVTVKSVGMSTRREETEEVEEVTTTVMTAPLVSSSSEEEVEVK